MVMDMTNNQESRPSTKTAALAIASDLTAAANDLERAQRRLDAAKDHRISTIAKEDEAIVLAAAAVKDAIDSITTRFGPVVSAAIVGDAAVSAAPKRHRKRSNVTKADSSKDPFAGMWVGSGGAQGTDPSAAHDLGGEPPSNQA